MDIVTKENYTEYYPLFDPTGTEFAEKWNYDLSNLNSFLSTGKDYNFVSRKMDEIIYKVNELNLVNRVMDVRIDMNMNEKFTVNLTSVRGKDLKQGDITPAYRTSTSGLPIFFTVDRFELAPNENKYMYGRELGMIEYVENDWYVVAKIVNKTKLNEND